MNPRAGLRAGLEGRVHSPLPRVVRNGIMPVSLGDGRARDSGAAATARNVRRTGLEALATASFH